MKNSMIINNILQFWKLLQILSYSIICLGIIGCSSKQQYNYSELSAKQIYALGRSHIEQKKITQAIKDFEELEANYPYGDYSGKAKLSLIYSYYLKKDYPQLKLVAENFLKIDPNSRYADYVHYMLGVANYDQYYSTAYRVFNIERSKRDPTLAISAFDAFKILLERFPNSKYAVDAKTRMIHLREQIAKHELYIAKYYLDREAYLSAANRSWFIVNNFYQTAIMEEALKVMSGAYNKLNMVDFEKNALNLLENYQIHNKSKSVEKK